MTNNLSESKLLKIVLILLFGFLFFGALYLTRKLLIPISFAALLAMLLLPVSRKFEKWGVPKSGSILLSLLLSIILIAGIITIISTQIAGFSKDLPEIRDRVSERISTTQEFVQEKFNVTPERQAAIVKERTSSALDISGSYIRSFLAGTTGAVATIGIILIYIFFFMLYRQKFTDFILQITSDRYASSTRKVIVQISEVTQQYLAGVLTVILILAVLNSVGLLIVGIKHAIFFGVLAAILNIIPYIGTFIGGALPTLYALLTEDLGTAVATASVFVVVQAIEGNFLTPKIVGAKVKINPLAAIVALLVGGALWGIAGMILFIPFLGVAKIIFDNVETLRPFGMLIGEDDNDDNGPSLWTKIKDKFSKKKS